MSPNMMLEMNSKSNVPGHHALPSRHHVRNLWPSVGGGLPGGKPIEPALGAPTPALHQPSDYYGQSTSYVQTRPVPGPTDTASVENNYYYKSSQVQPNPAAVTNIAYPAGAAPEYGYYHQQPKYFQHPVATDHWRPPTQTQTSQFYHPDPTTMFNQVSAIDRHIIRVPVSCRLLRTIITK